MSDALSEFLSDLGYGGAETGADIVRMLGVQDPTEKPYGAGLDPLFATVRKGLGELPSLLSTLTGQVQRGFQTGRAGLQERGVELGRAGEAGRARAGFAGAGALGRRERLGRRQLGQQFMGLLGEREAGMFGAEQRVESERAGLLGTAGAGIQSLLNALISGGVEFGEGDDTPYYDPSTEPPIYRYGEQFADPEKEILTFEAWKRQEGLVGPESWLRGHYDRYVSGMGG